MTVSEVRPDVSALVVSWNTRELTARCLATIAASIDDGTTAETIVVDNASTDGSRELLRSSDDIVLVENAQNVGYAAAVNQAYELSRGRFVLLLNSDIELRPGALSALVRFLDANPSAAGVGPLYLNSDGSFQQHHFRLPTFWMLLADQSAILGRLPGLARREHRYRMEDADFSAAQPVEQPSASVLLLRRDVLPVDHLLDERFPIFFNDVVLAQQLANTGHELWMTPEAEVVHAHGASTKLLGPSIVRHHVGAQVRYVALTESRARLALFRAVVVVHKLASAVLRRPNALPVGDLLSAARGDPGPLPQAPRHSWRSR